MKSPVIAQLLPALHHGGVERGTVEIANHLASQKWKSIVISAGGPLQAKLHPDVEHITLDLGKKSLFTLFKVRALRKLLISKKVNVVHARSRLPAWMCLKAIEKIKHPAPKFITTVHGLYSVKRYSSIMARGDRVIVVSQTAKEYVEKHYSQHLKHPVRLIYRGIDPGDFPYQKADEEFERGFYEKHTSLKGKKLVLLPGRLSSIKGLKELKHWLADTQAQLLLTALPDSNKESENAWQWLKSKDLDTKVSWVGFHSQISRLYQLADIVVSPSTRPESFGRTVAEALATGTPVVGYAHGGVKEILDRIHPQGQVPPFDTLTLKNTIEEHLKNPKSVPDNQPFLLSDMLQKTTDLYQECLNEA